MRFQWALLAAAGITWLSCASARAPRVGDAPPAFRDPVEEARYQDLLKQYSAHGAIYEGLDTRLFVSATLQTPTFVRARVERLAKFQSLPSPQRDAIWRIERDRAIESTEFHFGAHANELRHDDFDRPGSIWKVTLRQGDNAYVPDRIERLGRTTPNDRALYPYMDNFWVAYRVVFPKMTADEPVTLTVSSVLGRVDLHFAHLQ